MSDIAFLAARLYQSGHSPKMPPGIHPSLGVPGDDLKVSWLLVHNWNRKATVTPGFMRGVQ